MKKQINYLILDGNVLTDFKSEMGSNAGQFNCTTWLPFDVTTPKYKQFEVNFVKEQKYLCAKDNNFPRDKCTAIAKPIFQNAPRLQVRLEKLKIPGIYRKVKSYK